MLVLVVGGFRVMEGHLSIGMLVAFQSLMQSFLAPVTTLVNLGSTLQELQGDVLRLDDVLHNPTDPESAPEQAPPPRSPGHIACRVLLSCAMSPLAIAVLIRRWWKI